MGSTLTTELALGVAADTRCAHCGLEATAGDARTVDGATYCCAGCETAARIITLSGLGGFYALPERRASRVAPSGRSYAEFDHEAFHAAHVKALPDGLREVQFYLEGVHCASCVWLVERVPMIVPGAVRAELDVTRAVARLAWDPQAVSLSTLARALDQLGYPPHAFRGRRADEARKAEERAMLTRIGVAAAIAGNVMTIALALYSGVFSGMEREFERYFRWLSWILVTPALVWPGRTFFTSAWQALKNKRLHMDVPIALALALGYVQGAINTLRDGGPIYFDAVGTLIFLLLVGRYLQHRAQRSAADSAALLGALSPATARIVDGDAVKEVPSEAVLPGMTLDLRPGDTLAADGTVMRGSSSLDLALLTGESRPVRVGEGEKVFAGTVNLSAPLRVYVEEAGITSRLGRLLRDVEEGSRERPPVVLLADRIAGYFIAVVLVLAAVTAGIWWDTSAYFAIDSAIALLVVTCPCALAIATPLAFTVAVGRAAGRGILVKGAHALETLTGRGTIFLDKTGTLTEGRMVLEAYDGPDALRGAILALERHSRHPVATAFAEAWADVEVPDVEDYEETLGGGVRGRVQGRELMVGRPEWVLAQISGAADVHSPFDPRLTPVFIAVDGELVARAGFGDPLRATAPAMVQELQRHGWRVRLLSGDAPSVVQSVAAVLGIPAEDAEGGASPERKREAITAARAQGTVVMVGDGVNDAAAIAAATVGIAVRGGAEASMAAADVYLAKQGVGSLAELFTGARRTTSVIQRNMAVALGYNAISVAMAMMGILDPLFAAVLMPLGSVTVILATWRATTFPKGAA
ncbi:MAG TPA: heavy metal translocating P-type ATPase metal-binding domain-containing protein [Gemmatimonadaceae bacterium]|nr:heavy metal translocating P-type ATPase metal-binding domain-containing protein [Gemmatimonadaceae bacterium]